MPWLRNETSLPASSERQPLNRASGSLLNHEPTRSAGWHPVWPLVAAFVLYPAWWLLGFGPFVWIVFAAPMALRLLVAREPSRVPQGFGFWLVFLALVLLSGSQLGSFSQLLGFTFRFGEFIAATIIFVYAYNIPKSQLSAKGGVRIIAGVWVSVVLGGYIALAFPEGSLPSLSARVLPHSIATHDFVSQLITPEFAQVHNFLGFPLPRPSAPFTYTNTWGAVFALTLPFVLALALAAETRRARLALYAAVGLGMIPALLSVNRTMWAAIVLAVAFMAIAAPEGAARQTLRSLLLVGLLLLLVLSATYIGDIVSQRIDTPHSNAARADLANQALATVFDSPLLGRGQPQTYEGPGIRPPVGTQGYLWYIAVSHGLPALLFFLVWFALVFRHSGQGDQFIAPWFRSSLLAAILMFPFYGMRGMPLNVLLLAAALSLRGGEKPFGARLEMPRNRVRLGRREPRATSDVSSGD